jgi:hypothetical protein
MNIKFLLASLKTLTNSKDHSESRIKFLSAIPISELFPDGIEHTIRTTSLLLSTLSSSAAQRSFRGICILRREF